MTQRLYPTIRLGAFTLESGVTLPEVEVAHLTFGTLNARGDNAILVTHGYTSGPSMLENRHLVAEGSWAPMVGPGQLLDTDKYFIVCSNMLGSSFGTTGPRSINPATGKPWGPDFPAITLADIVNVQHRLLTHLGVRHLHAVLGPSYGGWQALQWALAYPHMVDAIGVICSGLTHPKNFSAAGERARFAASPHWHDGWHYGDDGMQQELFALRRQTLRNYGLDALYAQKYPDPAEREAAMDAPCADWARHFDPNSMVALAGAAERFDVRDRVAEIRARTLFVISSTDKVFPPDAAITALVDRIPAPHRYIELDSPYGHMASGLEWRRLSGDLEWLLQG